MAHHMIHVSTHRTLHEPGVSETFGFDTQFKAIEVVNRGDDNLFFTLTEDVILPYEENTLIIPPNASLIVNVPNPSKPIHVSVVSETAQEFSIQGRL